MSIKSARKQLERLGTSKSYCFPFALDSIMATAELPADYYDAFGAANRSKSTGFSSLVKSVIEGFFNVPAEPETDSASIGMYHAFGASVQSYCPDVPYEYDLSSFNDERVENKHVRLRALLERASANGCNILFSAPNNSGAHVAGLQMVDTQPLSYLIRDPGYGLAPFNNHVYEINQLWVSHTDMGYKDKFTPLPEFTHPSYPDGAMSWELIILPPEPA
jgi:hypothetical protein